MSDGKLVGTRLTLDDYNSDFHRRAVYYGSGFVGKLKDIYYTKRITWNHSYDIRIEGLIHQNGNIYFKEGNGKHNYAFTDKIIMIEGIDNIRHIEYSEGERSFFVYTDTLAVKYSIDNGKRTVLASNFKTRNGTSVEIDTNVWMAKDKVFSGYKEVYYNTDGKSWITYYIDENDDYYIERHFESSHPKINKTSKTLMARDVSTLPLLPYLKNISVGLASDSGRIELVDGFNIYESWHHLVGAHRSYKKYFMYIGNDGYLYSPKNLDKAFILESEDELIEENVMARPMEYGKIAMIVPAGREYRSGHDPWHKDYMKTLESFENGRVGFNSSYNEDYEQSTSQIKYANLTVGSAGDVVGDNILTSITPKSSSHEDLESLKDHIIKCYEDYSTSNTLKILLGQEIDTTIIMQDYENDPAYIMTMNTEHLDPNYYENSMGTDPNVGIGKAIHKFDYVGHYKMIPRVRDNPVGEDDRFDEYRLWNQDDTFVNVFVHRRPIAYFTTSIVEDKGEMTLHAKDNGSYDLDHESQSNKGIIKWEWSLKGEDDVSWQKYDGQSFTVTNLSIDNSYYLALRVQDEELVWSTPVIKKIESSNVPIGLTAKLKSVKSQFSPQSIPITEELLLYDIRTTYPKALKLKVAFYKNETLISTEKEIEFIEGDTGITIDALFGHREWSAITHEIGRTVADGPYTVKIQAVDVFNTSKSESIEFNVGVRTPIKPEPTLEDVWITDQITSMQCSTSIYTDEVQVKLFKGTPQETTVQMIYDSTDTDKEEKMWTLAYKVPKDITNGLHSIEFIGVVHTAPYKRESKLETVQVVSLGFEEVILTGAWNHWRGQVDLFGERLLDMPHRFLSWEKIYITTKTLGNPDRVTLELSPELEAMSFTDDNGKTFYYEDDFDEEVKFPLEFTKEADNLWTISYILPLADSSLSWENERERAPYEITVSAYKNGIKRVYEFNEANGNAIEITGNTTNLIYQQPVADTD